ncbi:MAG: penicillin-binding protein activator [Ketobacter sp.]|nr:MAG: hypothetical protein D6160_14970 [Ketobacter sp.]
MNSRHLTQLTTVALTLWCLLLAACTPSPPIGQQDPVTETSQTNAINQMLKRAKTLSSPESEKLLIEASSLLLEQSKTAKAKRILSTINPANLDDSSKARLVLALSKVAIAEGDYPLAEELLTTDKLGLITASNHLDTELLNEISLLRAQTWELTGNFLAAARERIFVSPMLAEVEIAEQNHEQIWSDLVNVPVETLEQLSKTVAVPEIQGWLELAWVYKGLQDDLDRQLDALNSWQQRYPAHPAATNLPGALKVVQELSANRPTQVAILLPMQGKYRLAAEAILNGFMTAHFRNRPSSPESKQDLTIRVYDTHDVNQFSQIYQRAVSEGADIILGPLQKENLRTLTQSPDELPITTIALNQELGNAETPHNLYQFGLSPEDDAVQVADHARKYNFSRAAVLYQDNPWWSRAYAAFTKQWMTAEGEITSAASFESQDKMANAIKQMLLVHQSELRAQQLKRMIGKDFEFQPRRRQDIDFIFLIASPEQARQIRPLLDFYYAQDIPVIAGSQIYSGEPSPQNDRDLNGIEFCDIPWLLEKPDALHTAMYKAWPKADHRYFRLNAMGVDAYRLQSRLQLLTQIPDAGLFGATGNLTVGLDKRVHRELSWAVIKKGRPQLLPKIVDTEVMESTPVIPRAQGRYAPTSQNTPTAEASDREKAHGKPS